MKRDQSQNKAASIFNTVEIGIVISVCTSDISLKKMTKMSYHVLGFLLRADFVLTIILSVPCKNFFFSVLQIIVHF